MHCYNNQRYSRAGARPAYPANGRTCPCSDRPKPSSPCQDKDMVQSGSSCHGQLAMGGVSWQRPESPTYDIQTAFVVGTIYKELNKPFMGKGGCQ